MAKKSAKTKAADPAAAEAANDVKQALQELKKLGGVAKQEQRQVVEIALKTKRSAAAMPLLARFPDLKKLRLSAETITGEDFRVLPALTGLEQLELVYCGPLGDVGLACVGKLTNLKHLAISLAKGSDVDPASFRELRHLTKLEHFDISRVNAAKVDFEFLSSFPQLKHLCLYGVKSIGRAMPHAAKCKQLENLLLNESDIQDEDLIQLGELPRLRSLNAGDCRGITGRAAEALLKFPLLEELWFQLTMFDDSGMAALSQLKHLTRLDLRWCPVTDRGLAQFQPPESLKLLTFHSSNVTVGGVKRAIAAWPQLEINSSWDDKELATLADNVSDYKPPKIEAAVKPAPVDKSREERIQELTTELAEKHKAQGEPLTSKKAVAQFNKLMKVTKGIKVPTPAETWANFKKFCELAIDCSSELFQIDRTSGEKLEVAISRFWYEPDASSDTVYMAECTLEVYPTKEPLDLAWLQFESLPHFVIEVEANATLWEYLKKNGVVQIKLYAGKR